MATVTRREYSLLLDDDLLDDWTIHLRSANRTAGTITSYVMVARHFATFLHAAGMPTVVDKITREHVETYIAARLETCSPATAAKHYRSLQQLFKWLISDGELTRSPMERMSAPTVPEQPVPILSLDDIAAMIATCKGNDFVGRRDEAIIRVLLDTGIRASELRLQRARSRPPHFFQRVVSAPAPAAHRVRQNFRQGNRPDSTSKGTTAPATFVAATASSTNPAVTGARCAHSTAHSPTVSNSHRPPSAQ